MPRDPGQVEAQIANRTTQRPQTQPAGDAGLGFGFGKGLGGAMSGKQRSKLMQLLARVSQDPAFQELMQPDKRGNTNFGYGELEALSQSGMLQGANAQKLMGNLLGGQAAGGAPGGGGGGAVQGTGGGGGAAAAPIPEWQRQRQNAQNYGGGGGGGGGAPAPAQGGGRWRPNAGAGGGEAPAPDAGGDEGGEDLQAIIDELMDRINTLEGGGAEETPPPPVEDPGPGSPGWEPPPVSPGGIWNWQEGDNMYQMFPPHVQQAMQQVWESFGIPGAMPGSNPAEGGITASDPEQNSVESINAAIDAAGGQPDAYPADHPLYRGPAGGGEPWAGHEGIGPGGNPATRPLPATDPMAALEGTYPEGSPMGHPLFRGPAGGDPMEALRGAGLADKIGGLYGDWAGSGGGGLLPSLGNPDIKKPLPPEGSPMGHPLFRGPGGPGGSMMPPMTRPPEGFPGQRPPMGGRLPPGMHNKMMPPRKPMRRRPGMSMGGLGGSTLPVQPPQGGSV